MSAAESLAELREILARPNEIDRVAALSGWLDKADAYCSACEDSTFDHYCPPRKVCSHTSTRRALTALLAEAGEQ